MSILSWINKGKKFIFIAFLIPIVLFLSVISGCWVIPLNREIESEDVVGRRENELGGITEEILKREIRQNLFVILGPDGSFKNEYWIFTEYHFKKDNLTKKLPNLDWDRSIYNIHNPILPIEGSSKWIAIKPYKINSWKAADIYVLIFDDKKIHQKIIVNNCLRIRPGDKTESYAIDYEDGNRKAIIHTTNGDYVLENIGNSDKLDDGK